MSNAHAPVSHRYLPRPQKVAAFRDPELWHLCCVARAQLAAKNIRRDPHKVRATYREVNGQPFRSAAVSLLSVRVKDSSCIAAIAHSLCGALMPDCYDSTAATNALTSRQGAPPCRHFHPLPYYSDWKCHDPLIRLHHDWRWRRCLVLADFRYFVEQADQSAK